MSDRAELRNPLYRNWIRAALGLKYLQQGLAGFVSNLSDQRHQSHLYSYLKVTGSPAHPCTECTADNLLPEHPRKTCIQKYRSKCFCNSPVGRRSCPNNFCSRFYDLIVLDHDERNPVWTNTDPSYWYKDHWSFARCFLATAGYSYKQSAADTDAAGLLSILINNVELSTSLDNVSHFEEIRSIRNDIVHSATFEIGEEKLKEILDQFIGVLKDKKSLNHDAYAQQAVAKLEKLKTDEIYINSVEADELHKNALEAIAEKKEEVIAEIDRKTFESIKRITETEKQIQFTQTDKISGTISDLEKQELQRYLVDLYRKGYLKTDLSPLMPEEEVDVDKVFVPLKMLKRTGNKPDAKPVRTLNDIFFCGNKHANCIYVSGDAGIGKTTLCRKLISEWCHFHSTNHIPTEKGGENYPMLTKTQSIYVNSIKDSNSDNISFFSENVPIRRRSDSDDDRAFLSDDNLTDTEYSSEESESEGQVVHEENNYRESALKQFYYLFFISLRDTNKERTIEEMVCSQLLRKQTLQERFKIALIEEPARCLFILDGLDEWIPPFPLPTHPTVTRGLPVSSGEDNFTKLFTSRPWKVELLRPNLSDEDLDISIKGIRKSGAECLVKNVFNELKTNKDEVELSTVIFLHKLREMNIECLDSVPLLLKLLVCVSEGDGEFADTQLGIYSSVISKLRFLAVERNKNNDRFESLVSQVERENCELPACLKKYPLCRLFSSLIHSLGRLSFETIFHKNSETALVFKDEDLTRYGISKAENELSMQIGLLSKKKVIGVSKMYPVRCVSFVHKTFQEYFAALYVAVSYEQDMTIVERTRGRCTTIENILDISKVFYFIKDINPSVLSRITGDIEINDKQVCLTIKRNQLTLRTNTNINTLLVAELFMSSEILSILVHDSDFGIHALRIATPMINLESLEFDSVEMTHSAFRETVESMPNTSSGVSVKFHNVAFKRVFMQSVECQVITCKHLRSIEVYFMNICGLELRFSETLTTLKCAKFYMVTMNEKELVRLLYSISNTNHDVIVIFDDIDLRSTVSEDSNSLTQFLTKNTNLKEFAYETKHVRSVTFRCSGSTVNCLSLKLDEVAGNGDMCLMYLKDKIENHSDATVVHIMSIEHKKTPDMLDFGPGFAIIRLGCINKYIYVLHLTNLTMTGEALRDILQEPQFETLVSIQLDNINTGEISSKKMYLHFKCHTLVMKRMDMCGIQLSLSRSASSLSLVDVTLGVEDFLQLLYSIKEIMKHVTLELENISLTKGLLSWFVQCGHIKKLASKCEKKS
ncbi:uncharacterized protein LOC123532177 [Mercenaria mercenaria]|uniref:uncharacterized protein LOC123532177 n=1 Tax=Mercenaria mercenaria TaxID=6596 RepID=UPI00234E5A59|nr:uncharacterized protein LOC123532177 [Mercenaria mercenaria]